MRPRVLPLRAPAPSTARSSAAAVATSPSYGSGRGTVDWLGSGGAHPQKAVGFGFIGKQDIVPAESFVGAGPRGRAAGPDQPFIFHRLPHPLGATLPVGEEDGGRAGGPSVVGIVMGDDHVAGGQRLDQR